MEITRRFIKFLEELDEPQVQQKYVNEELKENLQTIAQMINRYSFLDSKPTSSFNDTQFLEESLIEGCTQIISKLKSNLDTVCLLHTYATNFALNSSNISNFITHYCQSIFECLSVSIISKDLRAPEFMRSVDGQLLTEPEHLKVIQGLQQIMVDKTFLSLDTIPLRELEPYLESKDYMGNILIKYNQVETEFYLILHFKKDSPFTGSFISGKYNKEFPLIVDILYDVIEAVKNNYYFLKRASIIEKLESLKLILIELHKRYFLSFIATEIKTSLECEVATSVVIGEQEDEISNKQDINKKSIQMVVADFNSLELRNNFNWNNAKLNQKLSQLWQKFNKIIHFKEHRDYYHSFLQKTRDLFLEFSSEGNLIYQNRPLTDSESSTVANIQDFLINPEARSLASILSKTEKGLSVFENHLKETRDTQALLLVRKGKLEGINYEFIGRRKEGRKESGVFSIIFREGKTNVSPIKPKVEYSDNLIIDQDPSYSEDFPKYKNPITKMKRMFSARSLGTRNALGDNVDLSALKKTIVSEYLPEELTTVEDEIKTHESISSVNKIKLNFTSKTAFLNSPTSPASNKKTIKAAEITPSFNTEKLVIFTAESLAAHEGDEKLLSNWSFDAVNVQDHIEKSRLVWAMLQDFGLIKEFQIDLNILCEFINRIRTKYCTFNNAFHNYDHGITVMQGSYYILRNIPTKFTNLVNLGVLVSAFCHDVDHTGRNNLFEVNSLSRLALKYHDKSVLEQHHAAVTFKILSKETSNIFSNVKGEDYKQLRKLIISNILATDMKVHFDVISAFNDVRDRIEKSGEEQFHWNDDDVKAVTGMIVHCSDVCGPTKNFPTAYEWSVRVNTEFTIQVREEEALGIPITPYFKDLDKPYVMAKQEIAFVSFMIKPLWETFTLFFGEGMKIAVENIDKNLKEWNVLLENALKKKALEDAAAESETEKKKEQS